MATETPAKRAYCSKCARPAFVAAETLDPRYPLVLCSRIEADGMDKGHGRVPGTYDQEEADAIVHERKVVAATKAHDSHLSFRKANPLCELCRVDPPSRPTPPHAYEPFARKYRIAAHLEMMHHNRELLPRLTVRSRAELDGHHRTLHGLDR